MSVNFQAVKGEGYDAQKQDIQGTKDTTWGKSWTTDVDNSEIPVTDAGGKNLGYITREQANTMKALQDQGYKLQDSAGNEIKIGKLNDKTTAGDISNDFDGAFSEWLNMTGSDNVTPKALLEKVQSFYPNVKSVDEAVQIVLRNSSYQGALVSEDSQGVAGNKGGSTINFFKNANSDRLSSGVDAARLGGMTAYQQDSTGKVTVTKQAQPE
jgi:hypothetical protein